MEHTLLVPLDGSSEAEAALPHALQIAAATGWSICLVRVIEHPSVYTGLPGSYAGPLNADLLWEQEQQTARAYLAHTAAEIQQRGIAVKLHLLDGDPASAVLSYARDEPAIALVVMATHGRSGMQHLLFGSVAEQILHTTPVPLLLVRSERYRSLADRAPYHRVLVPLDGWSSAEHALLLAHMLARKIAGELLLLHAIPTEDAGGGAPQDSRLERDDQPSGQMRTWAEAYLQSKGAPYTAAGTPARALVRTGSVGEQIVAAAQEAGADLIVMATHGRTGWRRLWVGSVATYVVRHSPIPVLLVREEETSRPGRLATLEAQSQASLH